jgi:hypothetical protein
LTLKGKLHVNLRSESMLDSSCYPGFSARREVVPQD